MTATWKTVRVFIISTFRNMHAERDHLVKVVFPALRERLESIGFTQLTLACAGASTNSTRQRLGTRCLPAAD